MMIQNCHAFNSRFQDTQPHQSIMDIAFKKIMSDIPFALQMDNFEYIYNNYTMPTVEYQGGYTYDPSKFTRTYNEAGEETAMQVVHKINYYAFETSKRTFNNIVEQDSTEIGGGGGVRFDASKIAQSTISSQESSLARRFAKRDNKARMIKFDDKGKKYKADMPNAGLRAANIIKWAFQAYNAIASIANGDCPRGKYAGYRENWNEGVAEFAESIGLVEATGTAGNSNVDYVRCDFCPLGKINMDSQAEKCVSCAPGFYMKATYAGDPFIDFDATNTLQGKENKAQYEDDYQDNAMVLTKLCTNKCPKGKYGEPDPEGKFLARFVITNTDQFENAQDKSRCVNCPEGYFNTVEGADGCQRCPPGSYQNEPGKEICKKCPDGKTSSESKNNIALTDCNDCANTYFGLSSAETNIYGTDFRFPQYRDPQKQNCTVETNPYVFDTDINPGAPVIGTECVGTVHRNLKRDEFDNKRIEITVTNGVACKDNDILRVGNAAYITSYCDDITFTGGFDYSLCINCPPGKYQDEAGQTVCKDCPIGFFGHKIQTETNLMEQGCIACDAPHSLINKNLLMLSSDDIYAGRGLYQDELGQTECKTCPVGKYSTSSEYFVFEKDTPASQTPQLFYFLRDTVKPDRYLLGDKLFLEPTEHKTETVYANYLATKRGGTLINYSNEYNPSWNRGRNAVEGEMYQVIVGEFTKWASVYPSIFTCTNGGVVKEDNTECETGKLVISNITVVDTLTPPSGYFSLGWLDSRNMETGEATLDVSEIAIDENDKIFMRKSNGEIYKFNDWPQTYSLTSVPSSDFSDLTWKTYIRPDKKIPRKYNFAGRKPRGYEELTTYSDTCSVGYELCNDEECYEDLMIQLSQTEKYYRNGSDWDGDWTPASCDNANLNDDFTNCMTPTNTGGPGCTNGGVLNNDNTGCLQTEYIAAYCENAPDITSKYSCRDFNWPIYDTVTQTCSHGGQVSDETIQYYDFSRDVWTFRYECKEPVWRDAACINAELTRDKSACKEPEFKATLCTNGGTADGSGGCLSPTFNRPECGPGTVVDHNDGTADNTIGTYRKIEETTCKFQPDGVWLHNNRLIFNRKLKKMRYHLVGDTWHSRNPYYSPGQTAPVFNTSQEMYRAGYNKICIQRYTSPSDSSKNCIEQCDMDIDSLKKFPPCFNITYSETQATDCKDFFGAGTTEKSQIESLQCFIDCYGGDLNFRYKEKIYFDINMNTVWTGFGDQYYPEDNYISTESALLYLSISINNAQGKQTWASNCKTAAAALDMEYVIPDQQTLWHLLGQQVDVPDDVVCVVKNNKVNIGLIKASCSNGGVLSTEDRSGCKTPIFLDNRCIVAHTGAKGVLNNNKNGCNTSTFIQPKCTPANDLDAEYNATGWYLNSNDDGCEYRRYGLDLTHVRSERDAYCTNGGVVEGSDCRTPIFTGHTMHSDNGGCKTNLNTESACRKAYYDLKERMSHINNFESINYRYAPHGCFMSGVTWAGFGSARPSVEKYDIVYNGYIIPEDSSDESVRKYCYDNGPWTCVCPLDEPKCLFAELNPAGDGCENVYFVPQITFTPASCTNGGVLNADKTDCIPPTFYAKECLNGELHSDGSKCKDVELDFECELLDGTPAFCLGKGIKNTNTGLCTECPKGTYSWSDGSFGDEKVMWIRRATDEKCAKCPKGRTTSGTGKTDKYDCDKSAEGHYCSLSLTCSHGGVIDHTTNTCKTPLLVRCYEDGQTSPTGLRYKRPLNDDKTACADTTAGYYYSDVAVNNDGTYKWGQQHMDDFWECAYANTVDDGSGRPKCETGAPTVLTSSDFIDTHCENGVLNAGKNGCVVPTHVPATCNCDGVTCHDPWIVSADKSGCVLDAADTPQTSAPAECSNGGILCSDEPNNGHCKGWIESFTRRINADNPFNGVFVGNLASPSFVNIDNNLGNDMFVGNNAGEIWYYKNQHATNPAFTRQTGTNNPFDGVNVGGQAAPTFVDDDNDDDFDMYVGNGDGEIWYYKNTGSKTNPVFTRQTGTNNPFDGVDVGFAAGPTFADDDNDGDFDMYVGNGDGEIWYYKNTGSKTNPVFTRQTGAANPLDDVDVGYYAKPSFVDGDGDGDFDMYVGNEDGEIWYFKNTGSKTNPVFTRQTGTNNLFNGVDVGGFAEPFFVDTTNDQNLDMYVGNWAGEIWYYKNTGAAVSAGTPGYCLAVDQFYDSYTGVLKCRNGYKDTLRQADHNPDNAQECLEPEYIPALTFTPASCTNGELTADKTGCLPTQFKAAVDNRLCHECPVGQYQDNEFVISHTQEGTCKACDSGKTTFKTGAVSSADCKQCPAGKHHRTVPYVEFMANKISSVCTDCPVGQYQDDSGQTSCVTCPNGWETAEVGKTACQTCAPGKYNDNNDGQCAYCPVGRYSMDDFPDKFEWYTGEELPSCIENCNWDSPCPQNCDTTSCAWDTKTTLDAWFASGCTGNPFYVDASGLSSARDDPNIDCLQCPRGYHSTDERLECEECSAGKYQGQQGQGSCTNCASGKYSASVGATSSGHCKDCEAGQYQAQAAQVNCKECSYGQYQNDIGTTTCKKCAAGKNNDKVGSNSPDACVDCVPGSYSQQIGQRFCRYCEMGKFSNQTGSTQPCTDCDKGKFLYANGGTECNECPRGYVTALTGQSRCSICPQHKYQSQIGKTTCNICWKDCGNGTYRYTDYRTCECKACGWGKYGGFRGEQDPDLASNQGLYYTPTLLSKAQGEHISVAGFCSDRCPAGKYGDSTNATTMTAACKDCPPGFFQHNTGETRCWLCPAGYTSTSNGDLGPYECTQCPDGAMTMARRGATISGVWWDFNMAYTPTQIATLRAYNQQNPNITKHKFGLCDSCPVGRVDDRTSTHSPLYTCTMCQAGRTTGYAGYVDANMGYTNVDGLILPLCPTECPTGKFSNPGESCEDCPAGRYADTKGASSCKVCPPGKNPSGPTSCTDCPDGQTSSFGICEDCPMGKYNSNGDTICTNGGVVNDAGTGCLPAVFTPATCENADVDTTTCKVPVYSGKCLQAGHTITHNGITYYKKGLCPDGKWSESCSNGGVTSTDDDFLTYHDGDDAYKAPTVWTSSNPSFGCVHTTFIEPKCINANIINGVECAKPELQHQCVGCPTGKGANQKLRWTITIDVTNYPALQGLSFNKDAVGAVQNDGYFTLKNDFSTNGTNVSSFTVESRQGWFEEWSVGSRGRSNQNQIYSFDSYSSVFFGNTEFNANTFTHVERIYVDGECEECFPGTYNPIDSSTTFCRSCPLGKGWAAWEKTNTNTQWTSDGVVYQSFLTKTFGKFDCDTCPAGYYSNLELGYGSGQGSGAAACRTCPTGRYSDEEGLIWPFESINDVGSSCSSTYDRYCEVSSATGVKVVPMPCKACPLGYKGSEHTRNRNNCIKCEAGKYGIANGCSDCPSGKWSDQTGLVDISQCYSKTTTCGSDTLEFIEKTGTAEDNQCVAKQCSCIGGDGISGKSYCEQTTLKGDFCFSATSKVEDCDTCQQNFEIKNAFDLSYGSTPTTDDGGAAGGSCLSSTPHCGNDGGNSFYSYTLTGNSNTDYYEHPEFLRQCLYMDGSAVNRKQSLSTNKLNLATSCWCGPDRKWNFYLNDVTGIEAGQTITQGSLTGKVDEVHSNYITATSTVTMVDWPTFDDNDIDIGGKTYVQSFTPYEDVDTSATGQKCTNPTWRIRLKQPANIISNAAVHVKQGNSLGILVHELTGTTDYIDVRTTAYGSKNTPDDFDATQDIEIGAPDGLFTGAATYTIAVADILSVTKEDAGTGMYCNVDTCSTSAPSPSPSAPSPSENEEESSPGPSPTPCADITCPDESWSQTAVENFFSTTANQQCCSQMYQQFQMYQQMMGGGRRRLNSRAASKKLLLRNMATLAGRKRCRCTPRCGKNQHVSNGECVNCPTGKVKASGDDVSGGNTVCGTPCAVDEYVSNQQCQTCAPGKTTDGKQYQSDGPDTTCAVIKCGVGQRVENYTCVSCPTGKTRAAGDLATSSDSQCVVDLCAINEYVDGKNCSTCPSNTTNKAGDDVFAGNTVCTPKCGKNEHVVNEQCTACPEGKTNRAGDNVFAGNTSCTDKCGQNKHVANEVCIDCAQGLYRTAGDDVFTGDTNCVSGCGINKHVVNEQCTACPEGKTNRAGDNMFGNNTICISKCGKNKHVANGQCIACPENTTRLAGDDVFGGDTSCVANCAANEYFSNNQCVACPAGTLGAAGDDVFGINTTCDTCDSNYYGDNGECKACESGKTKLAGDYIFSANGDCVDTCEENFYVSNQECVQCEQDKIRPAGDDIYGGNTTCKSLCIQNQYVLNGECVDCPVNSSRFEISNPFDGDTTCNRDCEGDWTEWSTCSTTCGPGIQNRTFVVTLSVLGSGFTCDTDENTQETQECNLEACPAKCGSLRCPEGYITNNATTDCAGIVCDADIDTDTCCKPADCAVGFGYNKEIRECESCVLTGQYSDSVGNSSCNDHQVTECLVNQSYTYSSESADLCTDCPSGHLSDGSGQSSECNLCIENYHVENGTCTACTGDLVREAGDNINDGDTNCMAPALCQNKELVENVCTCGLNLCQPGNFCDVRTGQCISCDISNIFDQNTYCSTCAEVVTAYTCHSKQLKLQYYQNCV